MVATMAKKKANKPGYTWRPKPAEVAALNAYLASLPPAEKPDVSKIIRRLMRKFLVDQGFKPTDEPG